MPKLRGYKATQYLETQGRSRPARRQREVLTFPAVLQDAICEASLKGEVRLYPDETMPSANWLVLELRYLCRAMIDQKHPSAAQAGSVMILPTDGTVVRIVRRDRNMTKMRVEVIETPIVPLIGWEGKVDPLVAIMAEQKARLTHEKNEKLLRESWEDNDRAAASMKVQNDSTGESAT